MKEYPSSDLSYLGIPVPPLPESSMPITRPDLAAMPDGDQYAWTALKRRLETHIISLDPALTETDVRVVEPSPGIEADLAVACHTMARVLRRNPAQFAEDLAVSFKQNTDPQAITEVYAQNGYLNFRLDMNIFGSQILSEIESYQDRYGQQNSGEGKTVVIDCSSPNVAKYMSVGHLRSTTIGESLTRIHRARGYTVIRDNHLGDWGTQFGMLTRAHELWADEYKELLEGSDPVRGLYELYVRINDEVEREKKAKRKELGLSEDDESKDDKIETSLEREGRKWFQRLEAGDEKARELLEWATAQSLPEFQRIYALLGSEYEYMLGESFYFSMLPAVLQYMRDKGITSTDDKGAMIVDLSKKGLNKLVVLKSDGASLYATRDLATLVARCAWFNPASILYVVGEDQQEYFQQIFATFDMMTSGTMPHLEHIHFGMIRLPTGKMSTRAGRVIFLEDVLKEAIDRARSKTNEISRNLSGEESENIARQIGVGAVIFFDLGQGKERSINFDWDQALNFKGRSGPYIQYAHARMSALLRRAQEEGIELQPDLPFYVADPTEAAIIKHLSKFPEVVARAGANNSPNVIAEHTFQLASLFTDLYDKVSVFNQPDPKVRNNRLRLIRAAAQVVRNGLDLLCIEAPEKM